MLFFVKGGESILFLFFALVFWLFNGDQLWVIL